MHGFFVFFCVLPCIPIGHLIVSYIFFLDIPFKIKYVMNVNYYYDDYDLSVGPALLFSSSA